MKFLPMRSPTLRQIAMQLSFWKCESASEKHIELAAIAIAVNADRVNKVDIAWLPEDALVGRLVPQDSKSDTAYRAFASRHCDVRNLDYGRLGEVAGVVESAIRKKNIVTIQKQRVRQLLVESIASGSIDKDKLHPGMRRDLGLEWLH